MRAIWAIAKKELRTLCRTPMTLFFIFVFPLVIGLFFGSISGGGGGGATRKMDMAIVDQDDSDVSRRFASSLADAGGMRLTAMSRDEAIAAVRGGRRAGLIVIPSGFGEVAGLPWRGTPTLELGMDPSRTAEAAMAEGLVMQSMGELFGSRMFDAESLDRSVGQMRDDLADDVSTIDPSSLPAYNRMLDSLSTLSTSIDQLNGGDIDGDNGGGNGVAADHTTADGGPPATASSMAFAEIEPIDVTRTYQPGSRADLVRRLRSKWDITFPQAMLWGVIGCVTGFSVSLVRERTRGTMDRLQIAPVSRTQILTGKALACFLSVAVVIVVITAVGGLLGMRPVQPMMLAAAAVATAFCFVGVMMFVASIGTTEESVGNAAWGICMVMGMLGGAMVPLLFLPSFLQPFSSLSPVKWAILAIEGGVWRGLSWTEFAVPASVLVGIGVLGIAAGTWRLKRTATI